MEINARHSNMNLMKHTLTFCNSQSKAKLLEKGLHFFAMFLGSTGILSTDVSVGKVKLTSRS
jgi:hypothetical protein